MAFRLLVQGCVVYAEWGDDQIPTPIDLDRIIDVVARARREAKRPIYYIARVPADAPVPDAAFRQAMVAKMPGFLSQLVHFHAVMEGQGFVNTAKRAVLSAVFLAAGRRRTFFVHSRIEEVLEHAPPDARNDFVDIVLQAQPELLSTVATSIAYGNVSPAHYRRGGARNAAHSVEKHDVAGSNTLRLRRGV